VRDMTNDTSICTHDDVRQSFAIKVQKVRDSEHLAATRGSRFDENRATPRLAEIVSPPDGHLLGQSGFRIFLGDAKDLAGNVHGAAEGAGWDGGELGYFNLDLTEIKRKR
jgi:hypothetical protein